MLAQSTKISCVCLTGGEGKQSVANVGIWLWLWLYWYMWVCIGSSAMNPALRSHMIVYSGQDDYDCCWIWYSLIKVWTTHIEECGVIGYIVPILMDSCRK